jgi:hypothetical protein
MERLDQLTQRLADEAYDYEMKPWDASVAYLAVSRTLQKHAKEIAEAWNLENLRQPHPEQMDVDALAARFSRATRGSLWTEHLYSASGAVELRRGTGYTAGCPRYKRSRRSP